MSSSSAIRAGAAFVEIFADDSKLMRTLAKNQVALKKWGKAASAAGTKLIAAGTAMLAPLLAATRAYASMGAEMARGAAKTGMSVEALSALKVAAAQSGVGVEQLESAVARMNRSMVAAAEGSQQQADAFAHLGLNLGQLSRMKPEEQFRAIAQALSQIKNPNLKSGLAQQIFGRSGAELLPLLNQGAAGIDKMMNRAKELGLVMSTDAANGALELDQQMDDLWQVVKMGVFQIGGALAPAIQQVVSKMTNGINVVRNFVAQHQGLIVAAAGAGAALLTGGIILKGVGAAFAIASGAVGVFSTGLGIVGTVIAAAISPLGLMTAGLLGGAAAFLYLTQAGAATRQYLAGVFGDLRDDSVTAFGGIRDALTSGDWSLAAQILWTYIKLEFTRGTFALKSMWSEFKAYFRDTFNDAVYGAVSIFYDFCAKIESKWTQIGAAVYDTWNNFTTSMGDLFDTGAGVVMKGMNKLHGLWDKLFGDGSFNVDVNNQMIDAAVNAEKQQRDTNNKTTGDISKAVLQSELAKIERERQDAQANLAQQHATDQTGLTQEEKNKLKEYDDKINELKSQLAQNANHAHAEASAKDHPFNAPKFDANAASDGLAGMMKSAVAGTFSAAGAFGLGSGNAAERTAKNTEKTVNILGQMLQALRNQKQSTSSSFA